MSNYSETLRSHLTTMDHHDYLPPPRPPPLLSDDQILSLARNGWVPFPLPKHLEDGLSELSRLSNDFFQRPREVKSDLYPQAQGTEMGYYPVEQEKEYLTLRRMIHHDDSALEAAASRAWSDIAALLHRMLADLARELDLPPHVWDELLDGCLTMPAERDQMTPTLLRLFRYYPQSGFAAKHTDLGLLTLCVGSGRGLQVLDSAGGEKTWVDADGPIILAGEVLRILSVNRISAGVHRVVENPDGRSSVVFALRPSLKHQIDLDRFDIGGSISSEELWDLIKSRKLNINATKEIRERQREKMNAKQFEFGAAG